MMKILGFTLLAYLLGCFSTSYYLVRWRTGQDIRQLGTGTAGGRNAGRVLGKSGAIVVILGDVLKGVLAVAIAAWAGVAGWGLMLVLLAVMIGHIWPVQLSWHGGKGLATGIGALAVVDWQLALAIVLLAGLASGITRKVTSSVLIAVALGPIIALLIGRPWPQVSGVALAAGLTLFAHRDNLRTIRR